MSIKPFLYEGMTCPCYKFCWYKPISFKSWKPMGFEYCSMVNVGTKLYFYGGKTQDREKLVSIFDLARKSKWEITRGIDPLEGPPVGRISHTCITYGRSIFIYGGEKEYNDNENKRACFNDLWVYDTAKD